MKTEFCEICGHSKSATVSIDFIDNGKPFPVQHLCRCEEAAADRERRDNARREMEIKTFDYIRKNKSVSWAELEYFFNAIGFDYAGDFNIQAGEIENVIYWIGWNREALEIIAGLLKRGKIKKIPAKELTYLLDGKCLKYPIARRTKIYKNPHWLPIVFEANGKR